MWERRSEHSLHAIAEGRYQYQCRSADEHQVEVRARWDIPAEVARWHELALRARNRDADAARELAQHMVDEAIEDTWRDPCDQPRG